ncbi:MAG: hypothetical protein HC869_13935 [Rhodospirillales bacterium]|nr:hypothetical protein [Rhodospirillales bacterium]
MPQKNPSKASPRRAGRPRAGNFLRTLRIDHGPIELLGRFFLKAEMAARLRGLDLYLASFEELAAVNRENRQHWAPLLPQFRAGADGLSEDTAFCILGRNAAGEVVAVGPDAKGVKAGTVRPSTLPTPCDLRTNLEQSSCFTGRSSWRAGERSATRRTLLAATYALQECDAHGPDRAAVLRHHVFKCRPALCRALSRTGAAWGMLS